MRQISLSTTYANIALVTTFTQGIWLVQIDPVAKTITPVASHYLGKGMAGVQFDPADGTRAITSEQSGKAYLVTVQNNSGAWSITQLGAPVSLPGGPWYGNVYWKPDGSYAIIGGIGHRTVVTAVGNVLQHKFDLRGTGDYKGGVYVTGD